MTDSPYTYEPLSETRGLYCHAPRHGLTHVRAAFKEFFNVDGKKLEGLSCVDCHDETLRAYLDEMIPEITDEELSKLRDEDPDAYARYMEGGFDLPDADPHE